MAIDTMYQTFEGWLGIRQYLKTMRLPFAPSYGGGLTVLARWDFGNRQDSDDISGNDLHMQVGANVSLLENGYFCPGGSGIANQMYAQNFTVLPSGDFSLVMAVGYGFSIDPLYMLRLYQDAPESVPVFGLRLFTDFGPTIVPHFERHTSGNDRFKRHDTEPSPLNVQFLAAATNGTGVPSLWVDGSAAGGTGNPGTGTDVAGGSGRLYLGGEGSGLDGFEILCNQLWILDGVLDPADLNTTVFDTAIGSSPVEDTDLDGATLFSVSATVNYMPTGGSWRARARASDTIFAQEDGTPSWSAWSASQTGSGTVAIAGVTGRYQQIQIELTPSSDGQQLESPALADVSFNHNYAAMVSVTEFAGMGEGQSSTGEQRGDISEAVGLSVVDMVGGDMRVDVSDEAGIADAINFEQVSQGDVSAEVGISAAASEVSELAGGISEGLGVGDSISIKSNLNAGRIDGLYRIANDALVGYDLWRGINVAPDPDSDDPWQTFASSPFATPALDPAPSGSVRDYYFVLRRRNRFGLATLNTYTDSALDQFSFKVRVDDGGSQQLAPPAAPRNFRMSAGPAGAFFVYAEYAYLEDLTANRADQWAIYLETGGDAPDPDVDTPVIVSMIFVDGIAKLNPPKGYLTSEFIEGTIGRAIVRARRSSDGAESENTYLGTMVATATLLGPPASDNAGAWFRDDYRQATS